MKDTDFEIALRRFDPSDRNKKKYYYNGFSDLEGEKAYHNHLQNLYDNYISKINEILENQSFTEPKALSKYLYSKLILFSNNKEKLDENLDIINSWRAIIESIREYYPNENAIDVQQLFWLNCVDSQFYFIDKITDYLTQLFNTYDTRPSTQIIYKEDNVTNENPINQNNAKSVVKEIIKDVYTRKEACEYLQISNRKLTTLLSPPYKINPITRTSKPYTFAKKELERFVNQNLENY